ncbi:hypothetical protein HY639_01270 [Candidatus Woesearchaeota archaeon]|nr:hypothetical protein [Candidatus Woesearchaeota archaeon]
MVKKCLICAEPAEYSIKDTSDFYCRECAEEQFSDITLLIRIDENAPKVVNEEPEEF